MSSILPLLKATHQASSAIRSLDDASRSALLRKISSGLLSAQANILAQNQLDLDRMDDSDPKKDRLLLNPQRIQSLADSLEQVAMLPDPTRKVLSDYTTPSGLNIKKMSVPIGVVGVIYESRPNVTVDVAALCLRSGNAVVLRGGSDAFYSNIALVEVIHQALREMSLPTEIVQLLPVERAHVTELLTAVRYVDIIIPRGSQQLIDFVRANSKVPTIETGAGVCHTYVHTSADLMKASAIVVNAKTQRPSVCNALDTVLVDNSVASAFLPTIIEGFLPFKVEIFADERAFHILSALQYPYLHRAEPEHFGMEFLGQKCSIKVVDNFEEALNHIDTFSSRHSEAIVTEDVALGERFLQEVDAAAVYVNASTRFTDGGEFGLGAEIGISTQKLHARGPFALEKLTTEKWVCRGNGQIR
jgi:glutamate-5-semialdehyde dehydrogenase